MTDAERPDPAAALRTRAERDPEAPALFFRGGRGHFRWWSWRRLAAEVAGSAGTARSSREGETGDSLRELLRVLVEGELDGLGPRASSLASRLGSGPERDIWISSRPLALAAERVLLATALLGGWAVVREPVSPLPPETFAWARPTILSGAVGEVRDLLEGFGALAPRWGAARWRRRRLARLRAVILDEEEGGEPISARLAGLGSSARVVPLPPPSMERNGVVERRAEGEPP
ncbi:MAG TPA: hypothetical protein VLA66_08655 [Thermoanaerobaculia bacterium]|nr:hypothetical protein [Thermoanaerobaculia bacterium]